MVAAPGAGQLSPAGKTGGHQSSGSSTLSPAALSHPTQLFCRHACSSQKCGEMHSHCGCTGWMQPWSTAVPVPWLRSLWAPGSGTHLSLLAWEVAGAMGRLVRAAHPLPPSHHWWHLRKSNRTRPLSRGSDTPLCLRMLHTASVPRSGAGTRVPFEFPSPPGQPLGSNPGCGGCRGQRHSWHPVAGACASLHGEGCTPAGI